MSTELSVRINDSLYFGSNQELHPWWIEGIFGDSAQLDELKGFARKALEILAKTVFYYAVSQCRRAFQDGCIDHGSKELDLTGAYQAAKEYRYVHTTDVVSKYYDCVFQGNQNEMFPDGEAGHVDVAEFISYTGACADNIFESELDPFIVSCSNSAIFGHVLFPASDQEASC